MIYGFSTSICYFFEALPHRCARHSIPEISLQPVITIVITPLLSGGKSFIVAFGAQIPRWVERRVSLATETSADVLAKVASQRAI